MKKLLLLSFLFLPTPAMADYVQGGGVQRTTCYENQYHEEYIPGNERRPGRVISTTKRVRVPCGGTSHNHSTAPNVSTGRVERYSEDGNSCAEGSLLGAIAGGGAGAALSRGDGRWWAIPLGVVTGAMVGCQVDGG